MAKVYNIDVPTIIRETKDHTYIDYAFQVQSANKNLSAMSLETIKKTIHSGHEGAVKGAEKFISLIENNLTLPVTGGFEVIRSPFGPHVSTGDWLANSPSPCRRKVRRVSEVAPIKVVVGNFVSFGVTAAEYTRRSEAIIAFLMIVQRYRPIDLYASIESSAGSVNVYGLLRLESRPINLSEVGFVIGHPAFSRIFGFTWLVTKGCADHIPAPSQHPNIKREELELAPEDIYINSLGLYDELRSNPEQWIKTELARIVSME
jgi:hypothetical protein